MDNRRKNFVINKPFQYQYSLFIVALTILGTNIFLIIQMLVPGEQPITITSTMALFIGAIELFLVIGVWYASLKLTHRIAGPVYVMSREIQKMGRGDLTARIRLREKDVFQDEARAMNESIAELRARVANLKAIAGKVQTSAGEESGDNDKLIRDLVHGVTELNTGDIA